MAYWTTSGGFVFVTISPAWRRPAAAFVGLLVFELGRLIAIDLLPGFWQLILGSALPLTIPFLPKAGSLFYRLRRTPEKGIMTAILSARDLEKTFGSIVAARDITLDVPAQQTVGIIGPTERGRPCSST